jgi:sucrose-6-phosphate hydrolase SacC (GH32 family)
VDCPQLLQFGDTTILVISCQNADARQPFLHTAYLVGHLEGYRFRPRGGGLVDHGDAFYAATAGHDEHRRPLILGWARETLPGDAAATMPKVGAISLPRVLRLDGDRLLTEPASQLAGLRAAPARRTASTPPRLSVGLQFEALASIGGSNGHATLTVSEPGSGRLTLSVDLGHRSLTVDSSAAGLRQRSQAPIPPQLTARELRVYGDGSLIEVFYGGEIAVTTRWYRTGTHCDVSADAAGGAIVRHLAAWNLIEDAMAG